MCVCVCVVDLTCVEHLVEEAPDEGVCDVLCCVVGRVSNKSVSP